ncbi:MULTISPECIES: molecular chaperone DnaJ [Helcococcus]|uniref:Molecular chaperone DnaJ n=1 Tax=Helcococcus bovis TaxID=3153252 RepID=A0ABW9FA84_9FIRM
MSNIIEFVDYKNLRDDIEKYRSEITSKIIEKDNLFFHICKNIESDYIYKFGFLEYKAYELELYYRRLKKKLEILIYYRNHDKKIKESEIESILDDLFKEYMVQLDNKLKNINNSLERINSKGLSEEDKKELKSKYRSIIKKLHPDLNPELSESKIELFYNAVTAYKNGDLQTIKFIFNIVELDKELEVGNSLDSLKKEKDRLKNTLDEINKMIEDIKLDYPYVLKEYLEDEEKSKERFNFLNQQIETYEAYIFKYDKEIEKYYEILL